MPMPHAGVGFVIGLPPGRNGSCIIRDPKFGRAPGVYPVFALGTFVLDPLVPNTPGDPINLCYIPHGVILVNFQIVTSGVTGTLQDTLPTPTTYGTVTGDVFSMNQWTAADAENFGTMYFTTPKPVDRYGPAVVQWQKGITLQIVGAGAAPATPMIYMVEWAPVYDGGT